jgi:predicted small integral membrane protein
MKHVVMFRLSQLLIIFPCALREWINALTDIGQYERVVSLSLKITSFPVPQDTSTLFNRAIHSVALAKIVAISWVIIHVTVAALLTYGVFVLCINIKSERKLFNQKKLVCLLGLSLGIFSYVFFVGFAAMDYFLSWMQNINFNLDIMGYCLPLFGALLYLTVDDSKVR